jgi:hypothetical protein
MRKNVDTTDSENAKMEEDCEHSMEEAERLKKHLRDATSSQATSDFERANLRKVLLHSAEKVECLKKDLRAATSRQEESDFEKVNLIKELIHSSEKMACLREELRASASRQAELEYKEAKMAEEIEHSKKKVEGLKKDLRAATSRQAASDFEKDNLRKALLRSKKTMECLRREMRAATSSKPALEFKEAKMAEEIENSKKRLIKECNVQTIGTQTKVPEVCEAATQSAVESVSMAVQTVLKIECAVTQTGNPEGEQMEAFREEVVTTANGEDSCDDSNSGTAAVMESTLPIYKEVESESGCNTQCYNCEKFGHVCSNCRQPPRCLWCGGGHLHKECPEKSNIDSTPACCNCKLVDGEKPHPSNYRGCSHAKDEMQKRKSQRTPKTTTGRVFSSNHTTPGLSFAAALRSNTGEKQQPRRLSSNHEPRLSCRTVPNMQVSQSRPTV